MASLPSLPEELKFINPYLQRAQETRKREPVISYYCNYYAAKLAIEKKTKSKDSQTFLVKLLDSLEREKKILSDNDAATNDIAGQAYVENFSLKVFTIADNEDRGGKAAMSTAKTFAAASVYIEILKIFGPLNPEFEDKLKYAKWKTVDIAKALKEGRTPVPGPPGGEPEENNQNTFDQLPPAQTTPPNVDQLPFNQAIQGAIQGPTPGPTSGLTPGPTTDPTTIVTGPPPSSDNGQFPLFPSVPTKDYNNSVPKVQDLVSSFDQIDIGKQVAPPLPPLPPKINDYSINNNDIFDNQLNQQQPPQPTSNFTPSSNTNFYDIHQNYQQPPPPQQPPSNNLSHTGFTNDYAQHHYQPPSQSHNSFLPPSLRAPPQNYIQTIDLPPRQQPSFSAQPSQPSHQISQPPPEIDPTTVGTVQKYCKFASSALDYNDVATAVNYMNKALEALKPYSK